MKSVNVIAALLLHGTVVVAVTGFCLSSLSLISFVSSADIAELHHWPSCRICCRYPFCSLDRNVSVL